MTNVIPEICTELDSVSGALAEQLSGISSKDYGRDR